MIIEVNKEKLSLLKDSFINEEYITNEFNNNPFAKVLIYKENSKIVGYLYYSNIYDRIELNQIAVLKNYRNKGIASKLIEELLKEEKNISLEVKKTNTIAINLYKKYGFKQVALRTKYYDGIDGILMVYEKK